MKIWEDFLLRQELELGKETVKKWLHSLKVLQYDAGNLYLEAKDSFQALWFEEHIRKKITTLVNNNNKKVRVHLSIGNRPSVPLKNKKTSPPQKASNPSFQLQFDPIDPLCTFEKFVVHPHIEISHKILKEHLHEFNPIYLYGPSGSGKTHLAMALAEEHSRLGKKVLYTKAETFTDHVVAAIRAGEMGRFRHAYRNVDMLIVDDIDLFGRKGATQEEFFHTFNTLHLDGKTMVLTSKCPPGKLIEVEPRLVSRFEWGIVLSAEAARGAELEPILKMKAQSLNYPLPPKVTEFLIESFISSPKAVVTALEALILRSHIQQSNPRSGKPLFRPMTVQLAKHYLSDLLLLETQHAITPEKIVRACSEHYGIRPDDILGKAQTRDCAKPRQIAMFLCRHLLKLPFIKIGDLFDRDHSTVMSSVRIVSKAQSVREPEFSSAIQEIEKKLGK